MAATGLNIAFNLSQSLIDFSTLLFEFWFNWIPINITIIAIGMSR